MNFRSEITLRRLYASECETATEDANAAGLCAFARSAKHLFSLLPRRGGAIALGQASGATAAADAQPAAAPVTITLDEAIQRAQASDPAYAAARAASRSAALDRSIARAGLLPNARLYSQDIYTQPNGIYSEGDAGEAFGAVAQICRQRLETAGVHRPGNCGRNAGPGGCGGCAPGRRSGGDGRGRTGDCAARAGGGGDWLVLRFAGGGPQAGGGRTTPEQEAADFTKLTNEREQAREAAHADVVKAQLVEQQRDRDLCRCASCRRKGAAGAGRACCFPIRARRTR